MNTTTRIPIVLMSVEETAQAVSISVKTVRSLIRQGRLRAVNFGTRMTRIYLQDLLEIAKGQGYQVVLPSSLSLEGATSKKAQRLKDAETGSVNKLAKCRKTPRAGERAPDGVTHDTHYTMAEVLSTFNIKYGRFYEVRNRYNSSQFTHGERPASRKKTWKGLSGFIMKNRVRTFPMTGTPASTS